MPVYVGTSGWAYKLWKPAFYPEKLPQAKFLQHYATRLNTVEVNASFRRLLTESMLQKWIADTPAEFRFCIKAHQMITHFRRLRNLEDFLQRFTGSLQALAEARRLGAVLFQLPPDFKADPVVLDEFLSQLPRALPATLEFRHESWFADATYDVLKKHGAALCLAETDEYTVPNVTTAKFAYHRLRKSEYKQPSLHEIAETLKTEASGHDVYAFFKHEEQPDSPLNAEHVLVTARAMAA